MSLYKRKDSALWWVKLTVNGRRIQKSTGTDDRKAAQEYHDRLKAELWEQTRLGIKPGYLWQDAVLRWLKETEHKATHKDDVWILRGLDVHLFGFKLADIDRDKLDSITAARLADGVENGTVNRMLAVVRAILRRAALEWGWLDQAPKVRMLPTPKRRIRFLTPDEAQRLLSELPLHLSVMARFSLETGLRKANVTDLQWSQVDLVRRCAWIHPDQAKARRAIAVPLSPSAVEIVRSQFGKCQSHVFSYRGRPVSVVNNKAWQAALKRAEIEDFRWHDLRHTWASWHAQAGTPLNVLQELGGWESVEMVRRYAHLSGEHLSGYARSMTEEPKGAATIRLRSNVKA
jgi:integrase